MQLMKRPRIVKPRANKVITCVNGADVSAKIRLSPVFLQMSLKKMPIITFPSQVLSPFAIQSLIAMI